MRRRFVVTGGAGFIGSHVVDRLVEGGHEVHVVDDLSSGRREHVHDAATLHEVDVRDLEALRAVRERIGAVDSWLHLAAQVDVRVSVSDPLLDADINVLGTLAVIEAARPDAAPVVLASTGGAIYGEARRSFRETDPARPTAPYGASKLAAEGCLAQDARLHGSRHAVVRYANVYGPRQDPHGEAGVVAIFGGRIREGRPATIFGDGSQTRDYVFVADVVDATLAATAAALDDRDSTLRSDGDIPVYNVGTGVETSVVELWRLATEVTGEDPGSELQPARAGELQRSVLDPTRARTELDIPLGTTMRDGLGMTMPAMLAR